MGVGGEVADQRCAACDAPLGVYGDLRVRPCHYARRRQRGHPRRHHQPADRIELDDALAGGGEALIDGQAKQTFVAPAFAYIPPATRHNVSNTGKDVLEYVYVVAPAKLPDGSK